MEPWYSNVGCRLLNLEAKYPLLFSIFDESTSFLMMLHLHRFMARLSSSLDLNFSESGPQLYHTAQSWAPLPPFLPYPQLVASGLARMYSVLGELACHDCLLCQEAFIGNFNLTYK